MRAKVEALGEDVSPWERVRALSDAFRHREALAAAEAAVAPEQLEVTAAQHVQLGYLALRLGQTERAMKAWHTALKLDPSAVVPAAARPSRQ